MMRLLAIAVLFALSVPVSAKPSAPELPAAAPPADHAPAGPPVTTDPNCPPEHASMGHCMPRPEGEAPMETGPSAAALSGPEHAADTVWGNDVMAPVRRAVYAEHGSMRTGKLLLDRLEYGARDGRNDYSWEAEGWYGDDYDRFWGKLRGEGAAGKPVESAEIQALWSHALDPWFNLQAGMRYDIRPKPGAAHLAIGVQGLAPYLFEVDATAFVSEHGDLTARVEAEYDQRITNRFIVQPSIELNFSAQDVRSTGASSGLSSVEAGIRLRYEIVPEFAPYLGVEYEHSFADIPDPAHAGDRETGGAKFVVGVRAWF